MTAPLVLAVWIYSVTAFQAALPFNGTYQVRQFSNDQAGIDQMLAWEAKSGHDRLAMVCVDDSSLEDTQASRVFAGANVPRRMVKHADVQKVQEKSGKPAINAEMVALACAAQP